MQAIKRILQTGSYSRITLAALLCFATSVALPAAPAGGDYEARLEVETADFATSRRALLRLVDRSGKIEALESRNAGDETTPARLEARLLVPSAKLPGFLSELGSIGRGVNEKVEAAGVAADLPAGSSRVVLVLSAKAPESSAAVAADPWPDYLEAFQGLARFFAGLLYVLIWMSPLWLLLGVVFWYRRRIGAGFSGAADRIKKLLPARSTAPPTD